MDPLHKKSLIQLQKFLVKNLDLSEIIDDLKASEIISENQEAVINSKPTSAQKIREFLSIIPRCGPSAFDALVDALRSVKSQSYIADTLEEKFAELNKLNGEGGQRSLQDRGEVQITSQSTVSPRARFERLTAPVQAQDELLTAAKKENNDDLSYTKTQCRLLIINNESFDEEDKLPFRNASDVDVRHLSDTMEKFGVTEADRSIHTDLKASEIKEKVKTFVEESRSDKPTSLVILISSHGDTEGIIYGKDGETIKDKDIIEMVYGSNVPKNVKNYPKLLLFQCCRGGKAFAAENVPDSKKKGTSAQSTADQEQGPQLSLPTQCSDEERRSKGTAGSHTASDVIICYSAVPGEKAWRNTLDGSWMIHSFCNTLREMGKQEHIADILTVTNNEVCKRVAEEDGKKYQTLLERIDHLRKKWYL